ncbi:hypothetical protein H8D29_00395 [PVC group bacterium]|jgi:hypothetical protein|nr:hypothetical protein [PVC group bacterium]
MFKPNQPVKQEQVMPIVVGTHLQAEISDRQSASCLQQSITDWMKEQDIAGPPWPLVCSDLWYLNDTELKVQPTICVGHPDVNAATASLSSRMETARLEDDLFRIQLDPEFIDLKCCIWGVDDAATQSGIDCFVCDYLQHFLGSIFGIRTT